MKYYILFLSSVATAVTVQQYTTPVPILKQINRHNDDGSYSYGYEGADGSYKIESKYRNGEVFGKYGYVDDSGQKREIEYGASRRGFEPLGNEINVPPPTLNDKYPVAPLGPNQEDDGQYREDPAIYYKDEKYNNAAPPQSSYRHSFNSFDPKYSQPSYQQPSYQPTYQQNYQQPSYQEPAYQEPAYQEPAYQEPAHQQPALRPATKFSFDDFILNRPQSTPNFQPSYYTPAPPAYSQNYGSHYSQNYGAYGAGAGAAAHWGGHPATNVNLDLGSYTVNYKRR